jgi:UMF1 family MFS transporter
MLTTCEDKINVLFIIFGYGIITLNYKILEWRVRMFKLPKLSKRERAWVLYDIANSAFVLTVITVLFPILYELIYAQGNGIANVPKEIEVAGEMIKNPAYYDVWINGSRIFKYLTSAIALTVAILSPVMGAWSNYSGNKKKFFKIFLFMGILGGFGLAVPGYNWIVLLVIFTISSIGYNLTNVVYDAFLVDVTDEEKMDEISAQGFAWGYIGSLIPFFIGIIPYGLVALGMLDEQWAHYSISFAFVVSLVWWYWYSRPILNEVDQTYALEKEENSLGKSLSRLFETFREIKHYKYIFIFLIAYLLYIDVVNSVIRLATNIGGDLGVEAPVMLGVIVMVQVVAFPSAILYGRFVKKLGAKNMIFYGIFIYAIGVFIVSRIYKDTTYLMWVVGFLIGTAQGGIQSVSRSYFARMVPYEKANDFFGFFSVFGRFGGIFSPFLIAFFQAPELLGTNGAVFLLLIPLALASILLLFVNPDTKYETYISQQ